MILKINKRNALKPIFIAIYCFPKKNLFSGTETLLNFKKENDFVNAAKSTEYSFLNWSLE